MSTTWRAAQFKVAIPKKQVMGWADCNGGSLLPHAFAFFHHWNNRGRDYSSCRGNWGSSLGKTGFLLHHEDRNIWKQMWSTGDSIVLPCPELRADEDASSAISRTGSDSSRGKGWVTPQGQDSWHPGSWSRVELLVTVRRSSALVMAAWRVT